MYAYIHIHIHIHRHIHVYIYICVWQSADRDVVLRARIGDHVLIRVQNAPDQQRSMTIAVQTAKRTKRAQERTCEQCVNEDERQ